MGEGETEASSQAKDADGKKEAAEGEPRRRVGEGRMIGIVAQWKGKMGWIQPLCRISHDQAKRHGGRMYLAQKDIEGGDSQDAKAVKEGRVVDFLVYQDGDGLGAEECRQRSVLRMSLPRKQAREALKDSPQWSEYLTDSEHYPAFEREYGVLLRKYAWPLPFALVELWGHGEELISAAIALAMKGAEAADSAAASPSSCRLRLLISEDQVAEARTAVGGDGDEVKVSESPVFSRPLPCHEVSVEASKDKCAEVARAVLALTMRSGETTDATKKA